MRVLVCGSRHFNDDDHFFEVMNEVNSTYDFPNTKIKCIISGRAKGADTLARIFANANNIDLIEYPADWDKYGKAAGHIRNKQMLDEGKPDLVVAFLAKDSKGTKNMIEQATKANVPIKIINI